MKQHSSLRLVRADEATRRSMPEGEYHHFLIRGVPMMTRVVVKPGAMTNAHLHAAEEQTYYIIRGRGRLTVGDASYEVEPGTAAIIPPGEPHAIENTGVGELEYLMQYLWPGEAAMPMYQAQD